MAREPGGTLELPSTTWKDTPMNTENMPALVSTEGRLRSVRGLGEPNLARLYSSRERYSRRFLIKGLRECSLLQESGSGFESRLPLWHFYGDEARKRIDAKRLTLEGRRFWEHFVDGDFPVDDPTVASIPGVQARHVYEARLSRLAFMDIFIDVANEVVADCERGFGDWEYLEFLPTIYPYSALTWEPHTLAALTRDAALNLHARLYNNTGHLFFTMADRMIFQFVTELHRINLVAINMEVPLIPLDEALLDNSDFLLLFDPAWDGIESDSISIEADLDISGPLSWFGSEVYQEIAADLID